MKNKTLVLVITLALGFILSFFGVQKCLGQNIAINSTGNAANLAAGLDIDFTNKGLLIPRVTYCQRVTPGCPGGLLDGAGNLIAVAQGLVVYQTDLSGSSLEGFYYNTTSVGLAPAWVYLNPAGTDWSTLGNVGTLDNGTYFLGTTDNIALNFKANNEKAGRIDPAGSTFIGYKAGNVNAHPTNTGMGYLALSSNTTGRYNVAIGNGALDVADGISGNTAIGYNTLGANLLGDDNTAVGKTALLNNTASNNTAIGAYALDANTGGGNNSAIGFNALGANLNGNNNTALGNEAGLISTGSGNVFLGYQAGSAETGSNKLYIANSSANPPLIYGDFSSGFVGLGTIAPGARLHAVGTGSTSATFAMKLDDAAVAPNPILYVRNDGTSAFASGTAAVPSITFESDASRNTGLFLAGADQLGITSGGTQMAKFGSSGASPFEPIKFTASVTNPANSDITLCRYDLTAIGQLGVVSSNHIGMDLNLLENSTDFMLTSTALDANVNVNITGVSPQLSIATAIKASITKTAGTITDARVIEIRNPTGAGSISTLVGLKINNMTTGGANYAIQSNGGQSYHAGNLSVGSTNDPTVALDVTGAGLFTTSIKSSGATSGIGYATGAGGTVTQITSKATGVTIDKVCGSITTHNAALAAGAEVTFVVSNNTVASTDVPVVAIGAGGTIGAYLVGVSSVGAGSFRITLSNVTAGPLGENIAISFVIIKAVTN